MPEITIQVQNLSKTFGNELVAVDDVSFEIPQGQTLAVIGPSGCGKTTTLKMLNRLIEPSSGTITILGRDVLSENPLHLRRQIGYVMQGGGLFPHWSAQRNVGTVPTLLGWDSSRVNQRVNELMKLVGLELQEHGHRFPAELSGGQQQRVGIARALAADPPVILLDEPFSALDPVTRRQLQREFLSLKDKLHKTQVIVTHDLREAFLLGDQVLVMDKGRMMQCDTPERLKTDPANEFVSHFLQTELE